MKDVAAYEEAYNIPLVMTAPGIARDITTSARVSLHDLGPMLCDLAGSEPIDVPDSRSFASLLSNPKSTESKFI